MNEITRIHLAKTPYSIELGAKKELEKYLHEVGSSLGADEDVLREVEARMVELLEARGVKADQVIAADDVKALREQLGEPKVFADGEESERKQEAETEEKPAKRFMRDTDHAVFGGVCAGLASYFNVDVMLVRLVTVALGLITAGSLLLVYVLFWIITPAAKTTADKLTMAGKPVTLEALKDSVDTARPESARNLKKVARGVLGVFLLLATVGTMIGVLVGGFVGYGGVAWLNEYNIQPWVMAVLVSLIVGGIALAILLGLLTKSAFAWKVSRATGLAMMITIAIGMFSIVGIAISGIKISELGPSDVQRLTKTEPVSLPADVKNIRRVDAIKGQILYGSQADGLPIRAEVSYLGVHGATTPKVTTTVQGDELLFTVDNGSIDAVCPMLFRQGGWCSGFQPTITVYGVQQAVTHDRYGEFDQ